MKGRGWQGAPPTDDVEARERIIAAAMRCIDRYGPHKTGLSDVASELGVTRQTVYRLFPSTEVLLQTVAATAADSFVDLLVARARNLTDPAEMLVECLSITLEQLPKQRYLSLLFAPERQASFTKNITSRVAVELTQALLDRLPLEWAALGVEGRARDQLIEIYLRTLQSFALDPGPPRSRTERRAFLRRWIAPAIHSYSLDRSPANS